MSVYKMFLSISQYFIRSKIKQQSFGKRISHKEIEHFLFTPHSVDVDQNFDKTPNFAQYNKIQFGTQGFDVFFSRSSSVCVCHHI